MRYYQDTCGRFYVDRGMGSLELVGMGVVSSALLNSAALTSKGQVITGLAKTGGAFSEGTELPAASTKITKSLKCSSPPAADGRGLWMSEPSPRGPCATGYTKETSPDGKCSRCVQVTGRPTDYQRCAYDCAKQTGWADINTLPDSSNPYAQCLCNNCKESMSDNIRGGLCEGKPWVGQRSPINLNIATSGLGGQVCWNGRQWVRR